MESTIGLRIRQLRESKQLNVADFAKAAGVKPSAIYGLESGANKPSIETVANLRHSFPDLDTDWLLLGTGPMLRDGKALTPVAAPAVATGPTTGPETVDHALELMLRGQLLDRLADKDALIQMLRAENEDLRGKSPGSSDAAGPYAALPPTPHVPVAGFQLSVQRRTRGRAHMSR